MGAKEHPRRSHQTFIFKAFFVNFVLRDRLDGLSKRALHFQKMQYRIGFIDVFDALIESMLDHQMATPKSKNERHAAWERFGKKRNERHAAWERFLDIHGPAWWPKMGFRKTPKPFILSGLGRFFAKTEKHNLKLWNGRPRDIEKQSARAPTMKHYKNDGPPSLGKHNTGAPRRRTHAEHFERHAAWEHFFFNGCHAAWER